MKGKYADYYEPESQIHPESIEKKSSTLASKLGRILHRLIASIIAANELKIYSLKSRSGIAYWAIQDPISRRSVCFDSEPEVRAWLDKRHYH